MGWEERERRRRLVVVIFGHRDERARERDCGGREIRRERERLWRERDVNIGYEFDMRSMWSITFVYLTFKLLFSLNFITQFSISDSVLKMGQSSDYSPD